MAHGGSRVFLVAAAWLGWAGAAAAQPAPTPPAANGGPSEQRRAEPQPRTHSGLFLSFDFGPGALASAASQADTRLSGRAFAYSVTVGWNVLPNLVVAGQVWQIVAPEPDLERDGQAVPTTAATLGLLGLGASLTYYFTPVNVYVSATPSLGILGVGNERSSYHAADGFALRLAAGKEWWISASWALGLSLQYAYGRNGGKDGDPSWTTSWLGVGFSASYD